MSRQDRQEAANNGALRQRLLAEIAGTGPKVQPSPVAEAEDVGWSDCHPFRDLNVTHFARQLDRLFHHRWLKTPGTKHD